MISLGRHIIAELYSCSLSKIEDVDFIERSMISAADRAGATIINSTFHHFSPYGVSGVIVIQESHLSIHCWPEFRFASIDIYTCGDAVDPWVAYESLKKDLEASHGSTIELNRGQQNDSASEGVKRVGERNNKSTGEIVRSRNVWFTERNENIALSLKHIGDRLFLNYSPYQKIEIYETEALGKILVLDGNIACAEEDEYVYHEMITHVPVFAHGSPERVLIIGGGDGGTARELLKHKIIKKIDLVEIDAMVIEASKKYLPGLAVSLSEARLRIEVEDGFDFVKRCAPESYDVVIVDSDDPEGPGEGLFTEQFYREVYRVLAMDGIMVTQSESPRFNQPIFRDVYRCYRQIFSTDHVFAYLMFLPSFPSGMWSFSFCSKGSRHPFLHLDEMAIDRFCRRFKLKYYSYAVHKSAFVLPPFVQEMLK